LYQVETIPDEDVQPEYLKFWNRHVIC
jgi:hypothetical protein